MIVANRVGYSPAKLDHHLIVSITNYASWSFFLGVLGQTTPGNVRTGRTIGDYSPSAWTSCTSQVDIIHLKTDSFDVMRHHSCLPQHYPAAPHHPRQSSTAPAVLSRPRPSLAAHPPALN